MGERTDARSVEPVVPAGEDDVAFRLVPERGDAFEASLAAPAPSESECAAAVSSGWDCVLAFESTHAAMAANKALAASAPPFAVIPTPRAVSAGCGMSLRFAAADGAEARAVAASLVHVQGTAALYRVEGTSFRLVDRL